MIRGLYTSSAGMQAESIRQDVIANNLANLNTKGFKRDLAVLQARENKDIRRTHNPVSADPLAAQRRVEIGELGTGVLVDRIVKRFEQGDFQDTESPLDMALDGDGYFTLEDATGERLYTRAGDFTLDADGFIIDKGGRRLLGTDGPIRVPRETAFQVGLDGIVTVNRRPIAQLALARFADPDGELEKRGDTLFRFTGEGEPLASDAQVRQGMLEGSNVNSVAAMTEMIMALRQYEANQKAIHHQDETLAKAVNEIARG